jgi:hypothetical protein
MRRRERWRNLAWVQSLPGDTGGATAPLTDVPWETIGELLTTLCSRYMRYVEIERDGDQFKVRLLPIAHWRGVKTFDFGQSYSGTDLRDILAVARLELRGIAQGDVEPMLGASERVRCVMS